MFLKMVFFQYYFYFKSGLLRSNLYAVNSTFCIIWWVLRNLCNKHHNQDSFSISILSFLVPGNHWSYFWPFSFAFSRISHKLFSFNIMFLSWMHLVACIRDDSFLFLSYISLYGCTTIGLFFHQLMIIWVISMSWWLWIKNF